jgi:hypothetical protein
MVIEKLPEEFNGWLCPVFLLFGHVEVIDKDDVLLAKGCPENASPDFLKFEVDGILGLVG